MGRKERGFAQAMTDIVLQARAATSTPRRCEMRPSRQGKYLSVTCVVRATSREQLDALYQRAVRPSLGGDGAMTLVDTIVVRRLGRVDYLAHARGDARLHAQRNESTADELWLLEHPPVYTLGQGAEHGPRRQRHSGRARPTAAATSPITAPARSCVYTLVDLARRGIKVKQFVCAARAGRDRPARAAAASAGPARPASTSTAPRSPRSASACARGRAYHGLALNVDMDLSPFRAIDPCGYPGLAVTQTQRSRHERDDLDARRAPGRAP